MTSTKQSYDTVNIDSESPGSALKPKEKSKVLSYTSVVTNSFFPKKEQAIVIDAIDGIEIKDYIIAIATKTTPSNIIACSKISQNRICCYLSSVDLVESLTKESNNSIQIKEHTLKIRTYINKARRMILSNVHICIPNGVLMDKIKEYGVNPKSNLSIIRMGFSEPGFTHILSFRRQVFIDPQDINKLPNEFVINYDNTLHHIYISTDKITCFHCHQEGHTAKYCRNNATEFSQSPTNQSATSQVSPIYEQESTSRTQTMTSDTQINTPVSTLLGFTELDVTTTAQANYNYEDNNKVPQNVNKPEKNKLEFDGVALFKKPIINQINNNPKRPASSTTSMEKSSNKDEDIPATEKKYKHMKKKKKIEQLKTPPTDLQTQIDVAKINIDDTTAATFPISYEKFFNFLSESYKYKCSEAKLLASKYTENTDSLVIMMKQIYKEISLTDVKKRITRLSNQLLKVDIDEYTTSSDESVTE